MKKNKQVLYAIKFFLIVFILFFIGSSCKSSDQPGRNEVKIGTAIVEIVSMESTEYYSLAGYGPGIISNGIHDPVTARAIVMEDRDTKLAFVTIDVAFGFIVPKDIINEITEKTGIQSENIFISGIHTHSAPAMTETDFAENTYNAIIESVVAANRVSQTAGVYFNQGSIPGITYNRRNPERETEGDFATMQFTDSNGECIATVINFGCHAVELGADNREISADYVYYLRERIEQEYGGLALFFNRNAGDINPHYGYSLNAGNFESAEKFGNTVAESIIAAQTGAEKTKVRLSAKNNGDFYYNAAIIDFGSAQIITIPGESLTTLGKEIGNFLPGPYRFYFSYTNGHIGYIVPESEWGMCTNSFVSGCYEETRSSKFFAPKLMEFYRQLAEELF